MVEHNLSVVADLCDRVTVLARGEILAEGAYARSAPIRGCAKPIWEPSMTDAPAVSKCRAAAAWYGESHVLHGVDLEIREGETVTLLGRNGAGKTTTLRAIMGILRRREGVIRFAASDLMRLPLHRVAQAGLGYVPEERGIFASLTVEENLMLPPEVAEGGMSVDEIYRLCSPTCRSAARARAPSCRAASSRCWRSPASCAPASSCCCSTSRPKAWRR